MAAVSAVNTAESPTNGDSPGSPIKNRGILSSPWAQVVKGAGDSPENSESYLLENIPANDSNVGKKTAWNVISSPPPAPISPSVSSAGGDHASGGIVMGAASWPALSEATKIPLKSSSSDSPKSSTPDVSVPLSKGPITSNLHQPKLVIGNTHQHSSMNNAGPTRQRSMKRGGEGGGNRHGGFVRGPPPPPPLPAFSVPEVARSNFSRVVPIVSDSSLGETRPIGGFTSHPNPTSERPTYRSYNRRGNSGQRGRGDGRNNHHGGRRDQDFGHHNWSSSSSPHGRGPQGHAHRPHGSVFMGPPVQGAPPFTPLVRPYGNALVYTDPALAYYLPPLLPDSFRGMPYITGPPPPPFLVMSGDLCTSIIKQIEYYFSDANLVKDEFLRSKMDEQGWVPIALIANFPKVRNLTDDVPYILDCLRDSTLVEVQGDKVRRFDEWMKWVVPQQTPDTGSQSSVGYDNLTTTFQRVSLEENQDISSSASREKELANNLRVTNVESSVQPVC
ncbi:unnamed protein product [Amaranthus hypochondriacus]